MEYMMNLEKSSNHNSEKKNSVDNTDMGKKTSFSQTPQPSLKNVSNDMVKIIEDEISQVADSNKQKKNSPFIFGVI